MKAEKVVITDYGFKNIDQEREVFAAAGLEVATAQCRTEDELIAACRGASALLVQWAPVTARVIETLTDCRVIVRYGIGVDNVDLKAAQAAGIAVCNVPTYCIDEVADHSIALALSLCRQLSATKKQLEGGWKITPPAAMPAFREMVYVTLGFGRIAREVLERARGMKFRLAAYDPYVTEEDMLKLGVEKLSLEEAFEVADVLSLHLPLNSETQHLLNAGTIGRMKRSAVVVNTARGGLIDTVALSKALEDGQLGGAGLDVFEQEPLQADHPIRFAPNTELTSHTAWFSDQSVPMLQRLAAEEIVRGVRGEALHNRLV